MEDPQGLGFLTLSAEHHPLPYLSLVFSGDPLYTDSVGKMFYIVPLNAHDKR